MSKLHTHWEKRYQDAKSNDEQLPWDSRITPPEVVAFWQSDRGQAILNPVATLDIGSGTGTNLSYVAGLGHRAFGVELSGTAVATAAERHGSLPPQQRQRICMTHGSAASIPFADSTFHYALDIGCLHGLPLAERQSYAAGVVRTLVQGGYYHLYGFDKEEQPLAEDKPTAANEDGRHQGLGPDEVVDLLGSQMEVVQIDRANPNPKPCRWYLFQKS